MSSQLTRTQTTRLQQDSLLTAKSSALLQEADSDWYRPVWVDGRLTLERWVEPSAHHAGMYQPFGYHQGYWKPFLCEVNFEDSKT